MRSHVFVAYSTVGAALLAACSRGDAVRSRVIRSDSAGVANVTHTSPLTELRPVVTVAAEPRVRIGAVEGAPELLFNRVVRSTRLSGDRIAVANGQPPEIRVFGPGGVLLNTLGRRGQGPGEFQAMASLFPGEGDTLFAANMPQFQLLRFTATGGYLDMFTPSRDSISARLTGTRQAEGVREFLRNGSFVIATRPDTNISEAERYPTGKLVWEMTTAVWFPRDYSRPKVVGEYGGIEQMFIDLGNGRRTAVIPPGARRGIRGLGGRGTRLCVAGKATEIRCIDDDGAQLVVRWKQDPVPLPQSEIDAWKERERSGQGMEPAQNAERIIGGIVIPETRPPISAIVIGNDGRIFVAGPDLTRDREGWTPYRVFSPKGELLGVAELPFMGIHELGEDYVLGVTRNVDGVEFVVMYDVTPGAR